MAPAEMSIMLSLSHTLWNEQNVTAELSANFMNFKYFSLHAHTHAHTHTKAHGVRSMMDLELAVTPGIMGY